MIIAIIGRVIFKFVFVPRIKKANIGEKTVAIEIKKLAVVASQYFSESIAVRNTAVETAPINRQGIISLFLKLFAMRRRKNAKNKKAAIAERMPRHSTVGMV